MIKQIVLFISLLLLILTLKIPIENVMLGLGFTEFNSRHIAGIPSRVFIILFSVYLIFKNKIYRASNLLTPYKAANLQALLIPLFLFLSALFANKTTFYNANIENILIFILSTLCVGFAEELAFRGFLFPYITKFTKNITLSMVISSLIFGLIHYINLFRAPENFYGITTQVVFAFSLGMSFCGLLLRTKNIYVLGVLHFLFNISFGNGELRELNQIIEMKERTPPDIPSITITLIVFALIAISGLVMKKMSNDNEFLEKLLPIQAGYNGDTF